MKTKEIMFENDKIVLSLKHHRYVRCDYCECWSHYFFTEKPNTDKVPVCREHALTLALPTYVKSLL